MKKKNIEKTAYFSIILTTLILSPILPTSKIVAATPTEIFDTEFDTQVEVLMNTARVESLAFSAINGTEIFYKNGYGEQPGTDIVYSIGGISCIIAATALLQLKDDGLYDLDDPVNDYLPWILRNPYFPDTPITIYDVLAEQTMIATSSDAIAQALIIDKISFPDFIYETLNENGSYYSLDSWVNTEPGLTYVHSSMNWDLAAFLVEAISGEPYEQYVEKIIFTPLGMTNSEFTYTNYTISQLAKQYIWNETSGVNEEQPPWDDPGLGSVGMYSTVGDLSKFLIAHMNKGVYDSVRILEETTVELMHTTVSNDFGLFWGNDLLDDKYHGFISSPWIGAAHMITKDDLGIIVFVNEGFIHTWGDLSDFYDLHNKIKDITEYITTTAEELIPSPPTTESSLGFIAIPLVIAFLGTASIYKRKRNK